MSFWTAVVIIVAIATLGEIYRTKLKASKAKLEEAYQSLSDRVKQLEDRLGNLETIILEKERAKKYDGL